MSEQPRVPAGSPKGGEWTSAKSGSSSISGSVVRGDYQSEGSPGISTKKIDEGISRLHSSKPQQGTEETPFQKAEGRLFRGFNFKSESELRAFLTKGVVHKSESGTDLARDPVDAQTYVGGEGSYGALVQVRDTGGKIHERDHISFKVVEGKITFSNVERIALYHTPSGRWKTYSQVVL